MWQSLFQSSFWLWLIVFGKDLDMVVPELSPPPLLKGRVRFNSCINMQSIGRFFAPSYNGWQCGWMEWTKCRHDYCFGWIISPNGAIQVCHGQNIKLYHCIYYAHIKASRLPSQCHKNMIFLQARPDDIDKSQMKWDCYRLHSTLVTNGGASTTVCQPYHFGWNVGRSPCSRSRTAATWQCNRCTEPVFNVCRHSCIVVIFGFTSYSFVSFGHCHSRPWYTRSGLFIFLHRACANDAAVCDDQAPRMETIACFLWWMHGWKSIHQSINIFTDFVVLGEEIGIIAVVLALCCSCC